MPAVPWCPSAPSATWSRTTARYGKRAELSVFSAADHSLIRIDDEVPGIPADRLAEAFEPLVRLEPSRSPETDGIGLGIAAGIVSAQGGTLTLSNIEPGLRAEISLPILA